MKNKLTFWAKRCALMLLLSMSANFVKAQAPIDVEPLFGVGTVTISAAGVNDACLTYTDQANNVGANKTYTAILSGVGGSITYSWSIIGGATIVGSSAGASVTVKPKIENERYNKARLYLTYSGTKKETIANPCGGTPDSIQIDVATTGRVYVDLYQKFTYPNQIVGSVCVSAGDSVAYSIKDLVSGNAALGIGFDSYIWNISGIESIVDGAGPKYISGDSSALTFVFSANPTGDGTEKITTIVGRCNVDQTPKQKVMAPKLPAVEVFGGGSCIPVSTTQVTLTNTVKPGVTYKWLLGNSNFTFAPGSSENSQSGITVNIGTQSGNIYIVSTPSVGSIYCDEGGPVIDTIVIKRSLDAGVAISGPSCVSPGTPLYYLNPNVSTSVNWILPSGWSIPSGNEHASTVNITVASNASSGDIKVVTQSCPFDTISLAVNIKPGNPAAITGELCLAPGSTSAQGYSIAAVSPAAVNYTWSYPANWSVSGSATSNSITLIPDGITPGTISVTANGTNGCNSDPSSIAVNYYAVTPDAILSTPSCLDSGLEDVVTLSIQTPVVGQSYNWIVASGWVILSANTDSTVIQVKTNGIDGAYKIKARGSNACGVSAYDSTSVSIAGLIFDMATFKVGSLRLFSVDPDPVVDATYYRWFWNGGLYDEGTDVTAISIPGNPTSGTACVEITGTNGCITRKCLSFGGAMRMGAMSESTSEEVSEEEIAVYPNPATDVVKVTFNNSITHSIQLIDTKGNLILSTESAGAEKELNVSTLATGLYFVIIQSENGTISKKVQIVK